MFSLLRKLFRRTPPCCVKDGSEVYRYLSRNFVFDVDRANELVRDGREPVEVDEESVRYSVDRSEICVAHIAHVDPTRPGIIAHVQVRTEEGEQVTGHVLIDGNHRAARCLELNRPFFAYLLTEAESDAILIDRPHEPFSLRENVEAASPTTAPTPNP